MVITKEDMQGRVIAWAEFRRVNEKGLEDPCGDYVWVNEVWVHRDFRTRKGFNSILKKFINTYAEKYPWCDHIYWIREKYGDRMSLYNRDKMLRRTKDEQAKGTGTAALSANATTTAGGHTAAV